MTPHRRTVRANHLGIGLLGLVLLAGGAFAVGQTQGLWFAGSGHKPLLTTTETSYVHAHGWLWIVAAVAAALVTVVCLRWLLAQARRDTVGTLSVEPERLAGESLVGGSVVARAIEEDLSQHPALTRVRAEVGGGRSAPTLRLRVTTTDFAQIPAIRSHIVTETLSHVREVLDLAEDPPCYLTIAVGR